MQRLKVLGLALVAVFAMSVVAVASASAHEFEASKTGTATAVQTATNGTQVFHVTSTSTPVECKALKGTEVITATKTKTQKASVKYEKCTAFGFEAKISEAKYNFSAEGTVEIESPITIEVPIAGCTVTVGKQTVGTIEYKNVEPGTGHGKIEEIAKVTKITSKVVGGGSTCGGEGEHKETGTYTGNALVTLPEGEVKWV